ncbi:MAG: hypothetical protein OXF56_07180 [Rhodobacteraceae bacterium]|nr:hypothetical protein [Paracoccaceae bacterium]
MAIRISFVRVCKGKAFKPIPQGHGQKMTRCRLAYRHRRHRIDKKIVQKPGIARGKQLGEILGSILGALFEKPCEPGCRWLRKRSCTVTLSVSVIRAAPVHDSPPRCSSTGQAPAEWCELIHLRSRDMRRCILDDPMQSTRPLSKRVKCLDWDLMASPPDRRSAQSNQVVVDDVANVFETRAEVEEFASWSMPEWIIPVSTGAIDTPNCGKLRLYFTIPVIGITAQVRASEHPCLESIFF